MEGGDTQTVGSTAHNEIRLAVGTEIVRVTEVVRERTANGGRAEFLPRAQVCVQGAGEHQFAMGIIDCGIEDIRLVVGDVGVGEYATRPAALEVVRLGGSKRHRLFCPMAKVGRGDMSPVEAGHIRAIAVLLKEDMPAIVGENEAVRLVRPALRRHAVVARAHQIVGIRRDRYGQLNGIGGSWFGSGSGIVLYTRFNSHLIDKAVEVVERENSIENIGAGFAQQERLCAERGLQPTATLREQRAIIIEADFLLVAIDNSHQMVPCIAGKRLVGGAGDLPACRIATEAKPPRVAQLEGKARMKRIVDIA